MKIKLAIVENDKNYLNKISAVLTSKFYAELELYGFSDGNTALEAVNKENIDVFVASADFDIDVGKLSKRCGFAYLVNSPDIETYKEQRAICKFQKPELIYKEIQSIYSEVSSNDIVWKVNSSSNSKVISFLSANGGAGSSTAASACAIAFTRRGLRVLYLNFEQFGAASDYFSGQGSSDFGDVIYAIQSKKANLHAILKSTVKQDASGVFFYDSCKYAMDFHDVDKGDMEQFLTSALSMEYSHIILDIDFSLNEKYISLMKASHNLIFVSDGTKSANTKFVRAFQVLNTLDQQNNAGLCRRISILYNKFSNKTGEEIQMNEVNVLGSIPKFEHASPEQVMEQISVIDVFDKLI